MFKQFPFFPSSTQSPFSGESTCSYCFIAVKESWPQIRKGCPFCRFHWLADGTSHTSLCVSGECFCFSCTSGRTHTDKAFVIWRRQTESYGLIFNMKGFMTGFTSKCRSSNKENAIISGDQTLPWIFGWVRWWVPGLNLIVPEFNDTRTSNGVCVHHWSSFLWKCFTRANWSV